MFITCAILWYWVQSQYNILCACAELAINYNIRYDNMDIPTKIYIQFYDEFGERLEEGCITWCEDKIHDTDVCYVLDTDINEINQKRAQKLTAELLKVLPDCDTPAVNTLTPTGRFLLPDIEDGLKALLNEINQQKEYK